MLVERGDSQVQLFFGDDQRRGNHEVAYPSLDRDTLRHHFGCNLIHHKWLALDLVAHSVERLLCSTVFHYFDGEKETEAAHVANRGMFGFERFELFAHIRLKLG